MVEKVPRKETCRVLVIGSHRVRLEKVLSLLLPAEPDSPFGEAIIEIEYLPCVAAFDSFQDESGKSVRYLARVDYYPRDLDGMLASSPTSLLPYFDEECDNEDAALFIGIAGAAVGSGIEGPDDTARIAAYLKTMVTCLENGEMRTPILRTIEPNPGYDSMQDELAAYKEFTAEQKDEATRLHAMGPAKMSKFVSDFAASLIRDALCSRPCAELALNASLSGKSDTEQSGDNAVAPRPIGHDEDVFTCRICRTILFGVGDLQNPAHEPSQHRFSYRKMNHGACSTSDYCQSHFLQESMSWMGDAIRNGCPMGKFSCPFCDSKLGNWIWSGTQCSCGTWVVPAIQIPKSKVDSMTPRPTSLPLETEFVMDE